MPLPPPVSRHPRTPRRTITLAVALAIPALSLAHMARATDYHWTSPTSGDFKDAMRWNPAGVPSYGSTAVIDAIGAQYTVLLSAASLDTLVLDSPDATLLLAGSTPFNQLAVSDLRLESGVLRSSTAGARIDGARSTLPSSSITNSARIEIPDGTSLRIDQRGPDRQVGTFTHAPTGQLQLDGPMRLDFAWFKNDGGEIAGDAPIVLYNSRISTREGVTNTNATFLVRVWGWVAPGDGYVNANPAGQTIIIQGNYDDDYDAGVLLVDPGFTNFGTIVMESAESTFSSYDTWADIVLRNTGEARTVTDAGTIIAKPGSNGRGRREIRGDFINLAGATVTANGEFSVPGSVRNEGTITLVPGTNKDIRFDGLTQAAGTLDVRGEIAVGDFVYEGGVITGGGTIAVAGTPDKVLHWGNPALPLPEATFLFRDSAQVSSINSDIPPGYSAVVRTERRYREFAVAPEFTNHGTLSFETAPTLRRSPMLRPTSPDSTEFHRFINRGTFTVSNDSGQSVSSFDNNVIYGHMLNAATGMAVIAGHTHVTGDLINEGTLTIAAGKTLRAGVEDESDQYGFVQTGGLLEINGTLLVESNFTYRGGTITGNPIDFRGGTLINDADDGSASFAIVTSMKLAPAPGRAAVLAGQKLSPHPEASEITISGTLAWTNDGTIELDRSLVTAESTSGAADGRITNNGSIRLTGVSNQISATMVNNGTIVKDGVWYAAVRGGLENTGTVTIENGGLSVSGPTINSGTITLGPAAWLGFGDDVTNSGEILLDPTAYINLTTASLLHRAADAVALDAAMQQYVDLIRTGRVSSSIPRSDPLTGLAIAAISDTELLIKYTYDGDANLDGVINADDYFRIDSGFIAQPENPTYVDGDFNYDGLINADDYFLIDKAFVGQGAPLTGTGIASLAVVPEPAMLSALPLAIGALSRRRRRRPRL